MLVPRPVLLVVCGVLGALMVLDYYIKNAGLQALSSELQAWVLVIAGFAMVVASLNLMKVQLKRVAQRRKEWEYSLVTVVFCVAMAGVGVLIGKTSTQYKFLFNDIMAPIGSTLFACMIFFVTSASYRAFRVRNFQAFVLLASGAFVLLGGAPAGAVIWDKLPAIRDWFMDIPTVAGNRAIILSSAVGTVAFGLKVLLGIEKGQLGGGE
jgi:uncharacterized membrane protein YhaH (DUF805 family)